MNIFALGFVQFVLLLAAMGALFATIIIGGLTLIENSRAMSAKQWTSTNGMVVSSHVASERDDQDPKKPRTVYRPVISYTYFVDGKQYVCEHLHFGRPRLLADRSTGEKELATYFPGAPVTVYYNPENPQDAVLKRESPAAMRMMRLALAVVGGGVLSCIVAVLLPQWLA